MVAVSLFGVGFLVFVFVVAVVSFLVVGFRFFFELGTRDSRRAPTRNGAAKWDMRNRRQGPLEEDGSEI